MEWAPCSFEVHFLSMFEGKNSKWLQYPTQHLSYKVFLA